MYFFFVVALGLDLFVPVISVISRKTTTCQKATLLNKCIQSYVPYISACFAHDAHSLPALADSAAGSPIFPCDICWLGVQHCKEFECDRGDKHCLDGCICKGYNDYPMCKRCDWAVRACRHHGAMNMMDEDTSSLIDIRCLCGVYKELGSCYDDRCSDSDEKFIFEEMLELQCGAGRDHVADT